MAGIDQDIRDWATANNIDISGDRISAKLRKAYLEQNAAKPGSEALEAASAAMDENPEKVEEQAPKIPAPTVAERGKQLVERVKSRTAKKSLTGSVKKAVARVPINELLSRGWEMVGRLVHPVNPPVGAVLAYQSPVAGMILEDVLKGTFVDKMLQPVARAEEKFDTVFALVGPPALVGAMSFKPESIPLLVPVLRQALKSWLTVAGPKMLIHAEQEKAFEDEYGERLDDLIASFVAPIHEAYMARIQAARIQGESAE